MPILGFGKPAPRAVTRHRCRVAVALLVACALGGAAAPVTAEDSWARVRTRNFIVTGEAPETVLREAAEDLEAFRAALSKLYSGSAVETPVPTWVIVFKEQRRFQQFAPRDSSGRPLPNVGGCYLPDPDVSYIVFGRYDAEIDRRIVLHEYAHAVLNRTAGTLPLWLSEGLADFYSTFGRYPNIAPGLIGRPPADLLAILRAREFIPLDRIVMPKDPARVFVDRDLGPMFYAESWALVHYLMIGSPHAAPTNLPLFISELARGAAMPDAFTTAFGETIDEVDVKLRGYIAQPNYGAQAVDTEPARVPVETAAPLSVAEFHRVRGDLLLRVGSVADAVKELTAALQADPADVGARIALARTTIGTARHDEGIEALRAIATAHPSNFAAQYYLGAALTLRRRYEDAFAAFNRAALLRDTSASAWYAFSTTALALGIDDTAEAALRRAMQIEFNPVSYRNQAYAAFGFGRDEIVVADARRFINAVGLRDPSAQDLALLTVIAYRRAGQPHQADSLLGDLARATPRGSWNADLVDFLRGKANAERLLSRAKSPAQKTSAHTYIGLKAALDGRTEDALAHLRWVRSEGARGDREYGIAVEELARMELQPPDLR